MKKMNVRGLAGWSACHPSDRTGSFKNSSIMIQHKPARSQSNQHWLNPIQKQQFEALCLWINAHLEEPIGWQQLMAQSGLEYQAIQALFFKFESTTPMTWIRHRREAQSSSSVK